MGRLPTFGILAFSLLAPTPRASAQLAALETDDLRLVYIGPTGRFVTPHIARSLVKSLEFERRVFDYTPTEKITILLSDFSDSGNAGATAIPRNGMTVKLAPLRFAYETIVANERMSFFMNHELVHIMAADKAARSDRFFRGLFRGKVTPVAEQPETIAYLYLTSPREAAPRWYHEGIAVFTDTWMAGGLGRAQGAWDEMVFRSMVRDGSRFYDPLGLVSEGTQVDFQEETNSYLYGTRFMTWLAWKYSPAELARWVSRPDGSRGYYAGDFSRVFGLPLEDAWEHWVAFERGFQLGNLEAVRKYPTTPYEDLSPRALGSVSRAFVDPEKRRLYAGLNYPGIVGHVAAISMDDGSVERLKDVTLPSMYVVTSLAFDPYAGTLFYTDDNSEYRDIVALDPGTRETRVLLEDARVGDLAFHRADRSLWGIRHFNGICTLVRIAAPYEDWVPLRSWPYGEVIYDLDVSPDGRLVSLSHASIDGTQSLQVFSAEALVEGDAAPVHQADFGTAIPSNFVFSPDSRYLYGSSYYTGVSNIFRVEIESGALEAVTNTETGFFRPLPLDDGTLIVFRYTGEGFVPARIEVGVVEDVEPITFFGQLVVEKHPALEDWQAGSPADVPLDSMIRSDGPYRSVAAVGVESIYPVVQGYKDSVALGLRLNLSDPTLLNRLAVSGSYSPDSALEDDERFHLSAEFDRYDWKAFFQWNRTDFYDLFGPTKTSLKGYGAGIGYHKTLVYDRPRRLDLEVDATYYGGLERLPDFQGIPTDIDSTFSTRVRLLYENTRHSLGFVTEEKGRTGELAFAGDRAGGKSYPKLLGSFDQGFALPMKHSSIWLRGAAGLCPGCDPGEPFANFFFGAFGNNWVDHRPEQRYRGWHSFPGIQINEVGGRNFARGMLEWNLPPVRFRSAGKPGFYLTWARPALFASVLGTDLDGSGGRRTLANVGGQMDFRFFALHRMKMTVSIGYAAAFEEGFRPRHEGMISLKVLQ